MGSFDLLTKNRYRRLKGEIAAKFFQATLAHPKVKGFCRANTSRWMARSSRRALRSRAFAPRMVVTRTRVGMLGAMPSGTAMAGNGPMTRIGPERRRMRRGITLGADSWAGMSMPHSDESPTAAAIYRNSRRNSASGTPYAPADISSSPSRSTTVMVPR